MKCNGAEIIVRSLEAQGIRVIAGIPGGANLPLYDALYRSSIRHILARHEQGAGFIAQGMARSTGKAAVCFATSGPGATNLLTAIADAKLDSVPLIAITGQVATSMIGTDAFQEIDTYSITIPITKHNFLARSARELLWIMPEAFSIATTGRQGPVLIDVPKDVQLEEIEVDCALAPDKKIVSGPPINIAAIRQAADMIGKAKRPVIYAGGGIVSAEASEAVTRLAKKNAIPVALTLMGLGCFSPDDPLYLGMLGMHGALSTNTILDEADLLLALGVRFDDRAVGNVKEFCPQASIIHIDIDEAEIDKIRKAHLSIHGDVASILKTLIPLVERKNREEWMSRISGLRGFELSARPESDDALHPSNIIRAIHSLASSDAIITTDVGQHQMWVAQAYPFNRPRSFLTSGGLGTMGFGLPAAIGAGLANPGRRVICISGDGSFQMNIQEMATLAELNIPVTVIVLNNGHLGLVRQQQEMFYQGNYIACKFHRKLDFAAIGREFGIRGCRIAEASLLRDAVMDALSCPGPSIVDIAIHETENVLPMVPPGAANRDMIGGKVYERSNH